MFTAVTSEVFDLFDLFDHCKVYTEIMMINFVLYAEA